ncbi:hypothetical protein GZS04_16200 [Citrobacter freundii]|uniref:hypothetical protein n=3 Tax=Enterobacteriaceae TaxID=543 RepID=UPI00139766C7|nr:hypothetical protein [Citrobacter freundii]QHX03514.1 hypothetical protein GZS04_16200 [Citrobacter freundii]
MGEISVKTGNNARNGGKNSLNRLIRCVCGKKIGPDPRNFNQRVSLGRNDLLIRTFPNSHQNSPKLCISNAVACRFITLPERGKDIYVDQGDRILPEAMVIHNRFNTPFTSNLIQSR